MTHTIQLALSTVLFGEAVTMRDGESGIAPADLVLLTPLVDGERQDTYHLTPEQAIQFAKEVTRMAVSIINAQVGDDGKPTTLATRLGILRGNS